MKKLLLALSIFSLIGCSSLHQNFYSQVAPSKYPPTETVAVFEYNNLKIKELYELLFSDYLIIGKSGFIGPYQSARVAVPFAKSIGADVVISTTQFSETQTSVVPITTPTTNVTNYSGNVGGVPMYGSSTSFGTTTTMMPITVSRYEQNAYFLKNVNNIKPLWAKTTADYPVTDTDPLSGTWVNENYVLNVYASGKSLVAAINGKSPPELPWWKNGDIKFVLNRKSLTGIYLLGNQTPDPVMASINKFGHLEIKLVGTGEVFSFEKR